MFFPWVGHFEQIRLSDSYVHYDDVHYPKGHRVNRVQIKTRDGMRWLTVPLQGMKLGDEIRHVRVDTRQDWPRRHLALLVQAYAAAPYRDDMLALVERVYDRRVETICELSIASIDAACAYLGCRVGRTFRSSELGIGGSGSQRVLDIVENLRGAVYVTAHGAANYLDHEAFERRGVRVEYIDYQTLPYTQLHGAFTPYVSVLDLIANLGPAGAELIRSGTIPWRDHLACPTRTTSRDR